MPRSEDDAGRAFACSCRREQVLRGARVEVVLVAEPRATSSLSATSSREARPIFSPSSNGRDAFALPEGTAPGAPGPARQHPVARDLLDPPRRGAEHEGLALPRLVDHSSSSSPTRPPPSTRWTPKRPRSRIVPAFVTASRRAPVRPRITPAGAVPDDARAQLGELVRGIAAGEHVEHVLELLSREIRERIGAADEPVQLVDLDLLVGDDRDDLLREHVERVPRDPRLLDLAAAHRPRHHGRLEQVGPELGEDPALRDRLQLVAGASDALQSARDRLRALHLDDEVDGMSIPS